MPIAKSLWHIDSSMSEIRSQELIILPGCRLFKSLYSMISIGTEKTVALGKVPISIFDQMKVPYMDGNFLFPIKYGYSLTVMDEKGQYYHIMHPHQNLISVLPHMLTLLPKAVPARRATLISNLETVCNAYWDGDPSMNDKVLITGFGMIGALLACFLRLKGITQIFVYENDRIRLQKAAELGFNAIDADSILEFDLSYHTTSTDAGLQFCIDHMVQEGRVVEMSWYGDRSVSVKLGADFHIKRLSIKSSQVSSIPLNKKSTWNYKSRKDEVISMLQYDIWDSLLQTEISLEESVSWFDKIRKGNLDCLSLVIKY